MFIRLHLEYGDTVYDKPNNKALFNKNWEKKTSKKNFTVTFYGWGSTALKPLQGSSLLFTTKFPEIPGTHF